MAALTEQIPQTRNKASTYERIATGGLLVAACGVGAAVWYFDPVTSGYFPSCPLYSMTGIFCPGCGMTRAMHALLQGDVIKAIDFNALTPFFILILGYVFISTVMLAVRGYGFSYKIFTPRLMYPFLVIALIFGVARNIPVYPLNLLAP